MFTSVKIVSQTHPFGFWYKKKRKKTYALGFELDSGQVPTTKTRPSEFFFCFCFCSCNYDNCQPWFTLLSPPEQRRFKKNQPNRVPLKLIFLHRLKRACSDVYIQISANIKQILSTKWKLQMIMIMITSVLSSAASFSFPATCRLSFFTGLSWTKLNWTDKQEDKRFISNCRRRKKPLMSLVGLVER